MDDYKYTISVRNLYRFVLRKSILLKMKKSYRCKICKEYFNYEETFRCLKCFYPLFCLKCEQKVTMFRCKRI